MGVKGVGVKGVGVGGKVTINTLYCYMALYLSSFVLLCFASSANFIVSYFLL